jgi:hypothetical protein
LTVREDLAALAARAAALAPIHCTDCVGYHGAWPTLRLTEAIGGIDADRETLVPLLASLAQEHARCRWLIAGMSDTGLLAITASALRMARNPAMVTLVDRCATPLRLCHEYAAASGIDVASAKADLTTYAASPQDVVFAHSILSHIPADARGQALARMRSWLSPNGCLVLVARVGDEPDREVHAREAGPDHVNAVIDRARSLGLTDATALDLLTDWLPAYFARRGKRTATFSSVADLTNRLQSHGFAAVEIKAEFQPRNRRFRQYTRTQSRVVVFAWAGKT